MLLSILAWTSFLLQTVAQQTFGGSNDIPPVSLLVDTVGNQSINLRNLLNDVSTRKLGFHFGFAYDRGPNKTLNDFAAARLQDSFNHGVAENFCKWQYAEPKRNVSDLDLCISSRDFFANNSATFRLHNTFWHQQTPSWLPGDFSTAELVEDIIPTHVMQQVAGMGNLTSIDVLNEIVGDDATEEMTAYECVAAKGVWPTTKTDDDDIPLIQDLSFVSAALRAARAATTGKLIVNDYSTGGNGAKTGCYIKLAQEMQSQSVPLDGIGFQSHVAAKANNFDSKAALKSTFAKLQRMNLDADITEFDVWLQDTTLASLRWQAAIYGDYIDACLYSANCHEFVVWGLFDGVSWLNTFPDRGVSSPLLFDVNFTPKLCYYEVIARLQRYLAGSDEVCATAAGLQECNLSELNYARPASVQTSAGTTGSISRSSLLTARSTDSGTSSSSHGNGPTSTSMSTPMATSTAPISSGHTMFHKGAWLLSLSLLLLSTLVLPCQSG